MKFAIRMTELLSRMVIVEGDCYDDAEKKVRDAYKRGELILTADNSTVEFECMDDTDNYLDIFGEEEYKNMEVEKYDISGST